MIQAPGEDISPKQPAQPIKGGIAPTVNEILLINNLYWKLVAKEKTILLKKVLV